MYDSAYVQYKHNTAITHVLG